MGTRGRKHAAALPASAEQETPYSSSADGRTDRFDRLDRQDRPDRPDRLEQSGGGQGEQVSRLGAEAPLSAAPYAGRAGWGRSDDGDGGGGSGGGDGWSGVSGDGDGDASDEGASGGGGAAGASTAADGASGGASAGDEDPSPASPPGARARRGRAERRKQARKAQRRRRRSLLREIPVILVVAVGITLLLQTFLVQVFSIPSGSMEQTIEIGDRVVVNKLSPWFGWHPHRGDVVVFKDPGHWLDASSEAPSHDGPVLRAVKNTFTTLGLLPSDQNLIKRVIGVPGDVVACCDKRGRVTVNGKPLNEPYVYPGNAPSNIRFQVKVPPGHLWVMGDHRDLSADSRYHMNQRGGGFVPESDVVGRAIAIVWPVSRWQTLPEPTDFSAVPAAAVATSVSGRPEWKNLEQFGQSPTLAGVGPIPLEVPLVMGVAAAWPRVRARWRRRR